MIERSLDLPVAMYYCKHHRNEDYNLANLFPIGRNGMHRYNNSDHSMLTAMVAVENIVNNRKDKSNIWQINTEDDYHEESSEGDVGKA